MQLRRNRHIDGVSKQGGRFARHARYAEIADAHSGLELDQLVQFMTLSGETMAVTTRCRPCCAPSTGATSPTLASRPPPETRSVGTTFR